MRARVQDSILFVIDVQEGRCPVVDNPRKVIFNCARLLRGASMFGIPAVVTELCPDIFGPVMPDLRNLLSGHRSVVRRTLSCMTDQDEHSMATRLTGKAVRSVIIGGVEAHVSVLQTVLDLVAADYRVFVVSDACSSRHADEEQVAMARMQALGCQIVTTEMLLFEWVGTADSPVFRTLVDSLIR
ncbi:isochorismatase family protein [Haematospirillum sp. H1815]|uniref:isochorismatase family protein n=1 Tax=Haematospirillum sp. H1815 TaxID=2723108 RepID=UPI00143C85A3|nr:isochorismatase family protein [Haematospirillum sp. H1815]NKD76572.1 isochorismatase family protein [Haematospirillum sp. H1815]